MDFNHARQTTRKRIEPKDYCNGKCTKCGSTDTYIRTSHVREIPEMGTTVEEVIAEVRAPTFVCRACGATFTQEHPHYPPKFEYSLAVVEYALTCFHYHNSSTREIRRDLKVLHGVEVPEGTIDTWIKVHSADFLAAKQAPDPEAVPQAVEYATIDGTFVSTGPDVVGKKKRVDWLSVTPLASGALALTFPAAGRPTRARSRSCHTRKKNST